MGKKRFHKFKRDERDLLENTSSGDNSYFATLIACAEGCYLFQEVDSEKTSDS